MTAESERPRFSVSEILVLLTLLGALSSIVIFGYDEDTHAHPLHAHFDFVGEALADDRLAPCVEVEEGCPCADPERRVLAWTQAQMATARF